VPDTLPRIYGPLAADDQGPPAARPPLLLIHGLTFDRRQWAPVLQELDPGVRAVAVDLPGHGASAPRDAYDLGGVIDAIHEAATAAGLDAPVVVGHSLGGALATTYAAHHPVRGVVNVDQALRVGPFADVLRQAEPILRSPHWERIWQRLLDGMGIDELSDEAQRLVHTAATPRQDLLLGYWGEVLTVPVDELDAQRVAELRTIHGRGVPYHYVTGAEPHPRYRAWLEAAIPSVAVTVLPDSGHFPHLAQPTAVARIASATAAG